MDDETIAARMQRLAGQQAELEREQHSLKIEAHQELEKITIDVEDLLKRKSFLGSFLGISYEGRISHGELKTLCFDILLGHCEGLTSAQVRDEVRKRQPDMNVTSLPATLSYQFKRGNLQRDKLGRYFIQKDT